MLKSFYKYNMIGGLPNKEHKRLTNEKQERFRYHRLYYWITPSFEHVTGVSLTVALVAQNTP
jgi:hypothetical protein